jgi:uncharacterized membrane protein
MPGMMVTMDAPEAVSDAARPDVGFGRKPSSALLLALSGVFVVSLTALLSAPQPLRSVLAVPVIALIPGWLALKLIRPRCTSRDLPLALPLSLLGLILLGLVLDGIPGDHFSTARCAAAFDVLVLVMAAIGWLTGGRWSDRGPWPSLSCLRLGSRSASKALRGDLILSALGLTLGGAAVSAAVVGSARLDGGHGDAVSLLAVFLGIGAVVVTAAQPRGSSRLDMAVLYSVGLALLLLTADRGAALSGHDIKIEYRIMQHVLATGRWAPGGFYRAYNSCLSITILPVVVMHLTGVTGTQVFRFVFQGFFGLSGPIAYLVARRVVGRAGAVLAGALFFAFPTFINDLPMLNRQEIALLFLGVAAYALLQTDWSRPSRQALAGTAGVGMVLSHYSTTYVALAVCLAGLFCLRVEPWITLRGIHRPGPTSSPRPKPLLTWTSLSVIGLMALGWGGLNGTLGGIGSTITSSTRDLIHATGTRSSSAGYSLFDRPPAPTPKQALGSYSRSQAALYASQIRLSNPPPECVGQQATALPTQLTSVTAAGSALARAGIPPGRVVGWLRTLTVALFELGAPVGVFVLLWRRRRGGQAQEDTLLALGMGCLAVLAVTVVLPQVSVSYGLLRVYQEALLVLAPLIVVAGLAGLNHLRLGRTTLTAVVALVLASTTGAVSQLVGGYPAQMNLNNTGSYYAAYYVSHDEVAAIDWIKAYMPPKAYLDTDDSGAATIRELTSLQPYDSLLPGLVPGQAYVLTRLVNNQIRGVALAGDDIIRYSFPSSCLGSHPILFRSGQMAVLGPATVSRSA